MLRRAAERAGGVKGLWAGALAAALCAGSLFGILWAGTFSSPSFEIQPGTPDSGGRRGLTGSSYEGGTSAGESVALTMQSANYELRPGHMNRIVRPRTVTGLAGTGLSTGSVRLAWTAPGGDMFLGQLQPGSRFYAQYEQNATPLWSFDSAQVNLSTSGVPNGAAVTHSIGQLFSNSTYYFRVWHRDPSGILSQLSSEATAYTWAALFSKGQVIAAEIAPVTLSQREFVVFGLEVTRSPNKGPNPAASVT